MLIRTNTVISVHLHLLSISVQKNFMYSNDVFFSVCGLIVPQADMPFTDQVSLVEIRAATSER